MASRNIASLTVAFHGALFQALYAVSTCCSRKSAFSVSRSCAGMCVTSHSMLGRCSAGTCASALSISGLAARAKLVHSRNAAKATKARETGFIR